MKIIKKISFSSWIALILSIVTPFITSNSFNESEEFIASDIQFDSPTSNYEQGRNATGILFGLGSGATSILVSKVITFNSYIAGGLAITGAILASSSVSKFGKGIYDNIALHVFGIEDEAYGME